MSTMRHAPRPVPEFAADRQRELTTAWIYALASIPAVGLAYIAAIIVFALLGKNVSDAPKWAEWIAWGAAIVVLLIPAVGSVVHGLRARRWHVSGWPWPIALGVVIGGGYALLVFGYVLTN